MACCLTHQAITWTNVDLSSERSSDICLRTISKAISPPSINDISLKIIDTKFHPNLPRVNELSTKYLWNNIFCDVSWFLAAQGSTVVKVASIPVLTTYFSTQFFSAFHLWASCTGNMVSQSKHDCPLIVWIKKNEFEYESLSEYHLVTCLHFLGFLAT